MFIEFDRIPIWSWGFMFRYMSNAVLNYCNVSGCSSLCFGVFDKYGSEIFIRKVSASSNVDICFGGI